MTNTSDTIQPLAAALTNAVQTDDLDEACLLIQNSLGVTDGGVAGVCLSDLEDEAWKALNEAQRHARLIDYITVELSYFQQPEENFLSLPGFADYHTGGGCIALAYFLPDDSRWLVTDTGGTEIPAADDAISVGHYSADGDILFEKDYPAGTFDADAFLALVQSTQKDQSYDRDGMIDENERRAFADAQGDAEEEFLTFQATRKEMSAPEFGALIGDAMWEHEPRKRFLVYEESWWIEVLESGEHLLVLENRNWMTGEKYTLEDLEREIFQFAERAGG